MAVFREMLFDYANVGAASHEEIDASIWSEYGQLDDILVLDMSGFSKTTQEKGMVYYLALIKRMHLIVEPIIEQFGGIMVKLEADNCFTCCPEVNIAVDAATRTTPKDVNIHVAIGIDCRKYLLMDQVAFFGYPVSLSSKPGEDIAGKGEGLLTTGAHYQLSEHHRQRV